MSRSNNCRPDWKRLMVIGEYTVPSGPNFDDHFLVVVTREGEVFKYPAREFSEIIPAIEDAIGTTLSFQLLHSTDASSAILHPDDLTGEPLLTFKRRKWDLAKIVDMLKGFGFGSDEIYSELTDVVKGYVGAKTFVYFDC